MSKKMENLKFASLHPYISRKTGTSQLKIALFAAIPEEYCPFLKRLKTKIRKTRTFFVTELHTKRLYLLPTGMGLKNFWFTHAGIIPKLRPDIIISFGFCGGFTYCSDLERIYLPVLMKSIPRSELFPPLTLKIPVDIIHQLEDLKPYPALSVSVPIYVPKHDIRKHNPDVPSILDMETYYLAVISHKLKIPFISLRAMTDRWDEEVPFNTNDIIDKRGFVTIPKVLGIIAKTPGTICHMIFFRNRAKRAGMMLAEALYRLVNLPDEALTSLHCPTIGKTEP